MAPSGKINNPFQSVTLASLPQRKSPRGRIFDSATATLLAGVVFASVGQEGASDNKTYSDKKEANKAAGKARRMLLRHFELNPKTQPANTVVRTKVWGGGAEADEPPFRWAVYLAAERLKAEAAG